MARRIPKKYRPGELDAVRKKIGYVSPEEARRLTDILGGEIGIEKGESDLQKEKPQNDDPRAQKKNIDVIETITDDPIQKFQKISKPINAIENELSDAPVKKSLSYFDRIKIDFLCRKPEFGIKTTAGAIGALFSFLFPIPDNVNPVFINRLEKNILKPVVDLVKATRGLFTKIKEEIYKNISANPFYAKILNIIKAWDIESIELEIFHLKKKPRGQPMRNLLRLCKMIYSPLMLLSSLDDIKHILPAYKWAYTINIKSAAARKKDKERLISLYYDAEKNLPNVFNNLKKMLYPFLLKRVSNAFYHYDEFFISEHDNVINFLGIYPHEILDNNYKDATDELVRREHKTEEHKTEEHKTEEHTEKGQVKKEVAARIDLPDFVLKGLNCLEKLYPKAGWYNLDEFPDFYPYFQPIYNYPGGFELIPPADPLHQLIIFLSILNDLFYGFRHIKFGLLRDKDMESYNIQSQVEGLISSWPLYIDEIISKVYVSRLVDYSRQMEKDKAFKMSELGKKIITEMDWIKKNYLLPYLSLKLHTQIAGIIKRQLPKLPELTMSLKDLLSQVVTELKQKAEDGTRAKFESINNPWSSYIFDLQNNTSRRLSRLLYIKTVDAEGNNRVVDRRNNANLLFYTVSILSVLDYFVNRKESHLYYSPGNKFFRSIHTGGDVPQYPVQTINPDEFIKDPNSFTEEGTPRQELTAKEQVSLKDTVEQKIIRSKKKGTIFSLLYLNFITNSEENIALINVSINKDTDNIIQLPDTSLLILSDNRDIKSMIFLAKKLAKEMGKNRVAAGVIQYQLDWNYNYFLKVLDKVKLFTVKQGAGKLVYLDQVHNKFISIVV